MRRRTEILCGILAAICVLLSGCAGVGEKGAQGLLNPEEPVRVEAWTYYNGSQLTAFTQMVEEFNRTVGREKGIYVDSFSQGSVTDLEGSVLAAANGKVGAGDLPDMFAAYTDTAYTLDQMGLVADLSPYLTQEEREAFVEAYLQEGDLTGDGSLKIFPVAKSTEVLVLNDTDWQRFAQATGAQYEDFSTLEGLVAVAEAYYNWTDSLTPEPDDGKAFFGRDSMANYILVGGMQLGTDIFAAADGELHLNLDRDTLRRLWNHYYVPYVKGYFAASGRFRSDDMKTGEVIAFVGSSSGVTFFPEQVIVSDTQSYPITLKAFSAPGFRDGQAWAVQQGAGMVVVEGDEREKLACAEFLKWMASSQSNVRFAAQSGYLPVTKQSNKLELILNQDEACTPLMADVLAVAMDTMEKNKLYTCGAFPNGTAARAVLEESMEYAARADRAAVEERLAAGESLEQAAAPYLGDERFETWYAQVEEALSEFSA